MDLEKHEIWDQPVRETAEPAEPQATVPPISAGRLYASAGAAAHADAIVALPHHARNFVSVAELPDAPAMKAVPAPQAPIIADPAIAEVLETAVAPADEVEQQPSFDWAKNIDVTPEDPFKDWYAEPVEAAPVKTGLAAQQVSDAALRARTQLQDLGSRVATGGFDFRKYSLFAFTVTATLGVVDAFIGGTIGSIFGAALIASTTFGAFKLERDAVWVGWVMPAYVAIAAILVAGQFADGAPGFSIVGQLLLVGTSIITIAPWLAIATVVGALAPRIRKR